jgi:hypothetical protein
MTQNYAVFFGEAKRELGLQSALDVRMQFRLGKPSDVFRDGSHPRNSNVAAIANSVFNVQEFI